MKLKAGDQADLRLILVSRDGSLVHVYSVAEYLTDMQFAEIEGIYAVKMQDYLSDRLSLL